VNFLVDAQLPARLARFLTEAGHEALHTSELPDGNRTADGEINRLADAGRRVLVTKDRDFRDSHLLRGTPRQLLIVTTGNITNDDLLALFATHLDDVVNALHEGPFVELGSDRLIVHGSHARDAEDDQ
jgi:predicted nuclease of predicted toxin-antitoxin system